MNYQTKPVAVQAMQYTGKNGEQIESFAGAEIKMSPMGSDLLMVPHHYSGVSIKSEDYVVIGLPTDFTVGVFSKTEFFALFDPAHA